MTPAQAPYSTPTGPTFLSEERLLGGGPRAFMRSTERLLWHLGFDDVRNVDGRDDEGGDILAHRNGSRWVFQCKWTSGVLIGADAVREVDAARSFYTADRAVVVTNGSIAPKALRHAEQLLAVGARTDFWTGATLETFSAEIIPEYIPGRYTLHEYQKEAVAAAKSAIERSGKALVILATGLGKTVVAGELVDWQLTREPDIELLIVAHVKELVEQLERAMWRHLPKRVPTQILTGDTRPASFSGVTCATVQSALTAVQNGWRPGFVVVDEAHHAAEHGFFQRLLDEMAPAPILGLTATPWRGDGFDITERFGAPAFRMGIAEGMAAGFLAQVDYRLFVDELDWATVSEASEKGLSIRDLNHRLFLPQRDEAVTAELRNAWSRTVRPRAIVFCRTINHAEQMAHELRSAGWRRAACVNNRQTRRERNVLMSEFRDGRIPIVTAVDIFNEGVDVPDVNILCFLRVTHSRRIFVQQLGRGLRLTAAHPAKDRVQVLDFVSDIRRVAATIDLAHELSRLADGEIERLQSPGWNVTFSEPRIGSLLQEWITDAAALEDAADEVRLQFPQAPYA